MKQVIYVDILICINLFINYFILLSVVKISNLTLKRYRLIMASSLGALYSLAIFLPQINFVFSLVIKLLMSFSIILVAFGFCNAKVFIKVTTYFYIINFIFAGIIFFIWYFTSLNGIFMKNGIIYFNISPLFLIVSTLITYLIMKVFNILIGQKEIHLNFCKITITKDNKELTLKAKIDTGNTLKEPFSNTPVIVTNYESIKSIIKNKIPENIFENDYETKTPLRIRVVPFKTIMGEGLLPAFKPDKLIIQYNNQSFEKNAFIAICKENIIDSSYSALINPELLNLY